MRWTWLTLATSLSLSQLIETLNVRLKTLERAVGTGGGSGAPSGTLEIDGGSPATIFDPEDSLDGGTP